MLDRKTTVLSVCTITAAAGAAYVYVKFRNKKSFFNIRNPLRNQIIRIISNKKECDAFAEEIKTRCSEYRVLGFDCEWTTVCGNRQPVALLQLATPDGLCGLFRLNVLKYIPESLKVVLEDDSLYKVGVAPIDDAKYLLQDYSVELASSLDLRHLVDIAGYKPGGLSSLAKTFLNITLDKSWRIRCSDWESPSLNERQKIYAATDAHAAVEIFKKLANLLLGYGLFSVLKKRDIKSDWIRITNVSEKFLNLHFRTKGIGQRNTQYQLLKSNGKVTPSKKYANSTRTKPLYHNCFMEAPDGELLCTCDNKKALWYVDKCLADIVREDPLTVRLKFEPAGRSVGEVGQYYQLTKENKCVVCGMASSYIRKNVVPREYRKYFPEVMKDHSSHDVVLLCVHCHQQSNMRDQQLRTRLGNMCNAPFVDREHPKYIEDTEAKKIRSAARALLHQSKKHQIPEVRRAELVQIIYNHYGADQKLTDELLNEASNADILIADDEYEGHGQKVVEYFTRHEGGLLGLEVLWRQHFLDVMKPKFMPTLWSVNHNRERLEIRMREGRINEKDCQIAGLQVS